MNRKKSKRMADGGILLADAGTKETPEQMLAHQVTAMLNNVRAGGSSSYSVSG